MKQDDEYYEKLAQIVHEAVIKWDPFELIVCGAPQDDYDKIEKRFLSGIIN